MHPVFGVKLPVSVTLSFRKRLNSYLELLQRTASFFYGDYTDYAVTASRIHKQIRLTREKQPLDLDELTALMGELIEHCNTTLETAFTHAAEYLGNYFSLENRDPWPPRICVKCAYQGHIVDLFRNQGKKWQRYPIEENSGFTNVLSDSKEYLCNNIPQASYDGRYRNLRLDKQAVWNYVSKGQEPFLFGMKRIFQTKILRREGPPIDPEWMACWDTSSPQHRPEPESCYKSTLIVPMTLRKADISAQIRKALQVDELHDESTYGFLCFDHGLKNYFQRPGDVYMGNFFANILTLYMAIRVNYINNSDTFNGAYHDLECAGHDVSSVLPSFSNNLALQTPSLQE